MSNPTGYQFDGQNWTKTYRKRLVDALYKSRRQTNDEEIINLVSAIQNTEPDAYPPEIPEFLPTGYSGQITTDHDGNIWLFDYDLYKFSSGRFHNNAQNTDGIRNNEEPDIRQSNILNFGSEAIFYQPGKSPYRAQWSFEELFQVQSLIALDQENRLWFYHAGQGLTMIDHEVSQNLGKFPGNGASGVQIFTDNRVWVSNPGNIWEYENGHWQQYILPNATEIFSYFVEGNDNTIYGATDTSVFQIDGSSLMKYDFVQQGVKPLILSADHAMADCSYHKRYTASANCSNLEVKDPNYQFEALYLGVQDNGSVIFINNHLIARMDNGEWRSFLFDTLTFNDAAVDKDGYIWLYTEWDGLLRLDPDVFEDYDDTPPWTEE